MQFSAMTRLRPAIPVLAHLAVTAMMALLLAACGQPESPAFQGYVEGEFVRVAAPFAGSLERLAVRRGMSVSAGAALFALESQSEAVARREAQQRVNSTQARLANLKTGKRPAELDVIRAQAAQAEAAFRLSSAQLKRQQQLYAAGFSGKESLDGAKTASERDQARLTELQAQLRTAKLAARADEIHAAEAELEAARAALAQAEWKLAQKSVTAPVTGMVQDTLYSEGEWVPAGNPVVSLLPPANIKLRFFVPEPMVGGLSLGQTVTATCDGCGSPIQARLSYISRSAEYTPPVIYSKESRAKLVFLVEASVPLADATKLHPGQPVDVRIK